MTKFGLEAKEKPTTYNILKKSYVRVNTNSSSTYGKLVEINSECVVLKPSLIGIHLEKGTRYIIERKRPTLISLSAVLGMQPVTKEYLEEIVEESNLNFQKKVDENKQGEIK